MSLPNLDRGPCASLARLLLGLVFLIASNSALADRFARITMNWGSSTWSATSCIAGANTAAPPGAGDNVTICGGITVTQNVASPTINTLNVIGTLNASSNTLTIDNSVGFTLSGTFNAGTSTVVFNNPANTTLTAGSAIQFYNLTINPAPGGTPRTYTFGAAAITINNDFLIDVQSTGGTRAVTVEMGAGGITVTNNTTIQASGNETANLDTNGFAFTSGRLIVGTNGIFTAAAATVTLNATSGTLLTRTGTFTAGTSNVVMNPTSGSPTLTSGTLTFNDLTINMAGQTGTLGNTITVGSDLAINNGTLADGGNQIIGNATGTMTMAASTALTLGSVGTATAFPTLFTAGNITLNPTSTVTYGAGVAQTVSGTPTYGNLTINNASNVSLGGDTTVNGTLTFTSGDLITTAANTLTITSPGSILGAGTTQHVVGNLAKAFAAAGAFTYTVGDGTNYTPVAITFTALPTTGNLTVSTPTAPAADHPDTAAWNTTVDPTKSVNRYWTLKNSTLNGTYSAAFTYIDGVPVDRDSGAAAASFVIRRGATCSGSGGGRTCASWGPLILSGVPSNTLATATGISIASGDPESDFVVGEPASTRFTREKEFIYTRELY